MYYYSIYSEKIKLPGETAEGLGRYPLELNFPYVEELLEKFRPPEKPSRKDVLFMRKNCEFKGTGATNEGFIYTFDPVDEPILLEAYWVGVLQRKYPPKTNMYRQIDHEYNDEDIARNYWNAVLPPKNCKSQIEYVVKEAVVVAVSDEKVVVEPLFDIASIANSLPEF